MKLYMHSSGSRQLEVSLAQVSSVMHFHYPSGSAGSFMVQGQPESAIEAGGTQTIVVTYGGPDIEDGAVVTVIVEGGGIFSCAPAIIGEKTI